MERVFEGVWFPGALYVSNEFTFQEKVFLLEINSLSQKDQTRGCYASNRHFAEQFDMSPSRVSEVIKSLSEKGMVTINQIRQGKMVVERRVHLTPKSRSYWCGFQYSESRRGSSENTQKVFDKHDEPPSENAKENNTKVNISNEDIYTPSQPDLLGEPKKPAKEKRACRFETSGITSLTAEFKNAGNELRWPLEAMEYEFACFRDHWLGNGETKKDWLATWRNWLRRDYNKTRERFMNGKSNGARPIQHRNFGDERTERSFNAFNAALRNVEQRR